MPEGIKDKTTAIYTDKICIPQKHTELKFGEITVYLDKRFNRFQKYMLKLCFGFEVKDIKIKKKENIK